MIARLVPGGPFDLVLDVGGNIGTFAESAVEAWGSRVIVFEPLAPAADHLREQARGRWEVVEAALSREEGWTTLHVCVGHPTATSLLEPGPALAELGVSAERVDARVRTRRLDEWLPVVEQHRRTLLKVDVEGHEMFVLRGGRNVLRRVQTVVVEVQNDRGVYVGAPTPHALDEELRAAGLEFSGIAAGALGDDGRVLQFDGVWSRWKTKTPASAT